MCSSDLLALGATAADAPHAPRSTQLSTLFIGTHALLTAGFELPNEPEKKVKSRFDLARERKDGGPRPQRTYAERNAARGDSPRPDPAFSKTRPDGTFKPRSDFNEKPRPYVKPKPRTDAPAPVKKAWEDRPAKPATKDAPRPWKTGPAKAWKKK